MQSTTRSATISILEKASAAIGMIVNPFNRGTSFIRCTVLSLMALLVVADVLMRLITKGSIIGIIEIMEFGLVIIAFLGFAQEETNRSNINIDILSKNLPEGLRILLENLFYMVSSILFSIMSWQTAIQVNKKIEEVSPSLGIHISIFIALAFIGLCFLSLALYRNFILSTIELIKQKKTAFLLISILIGLSLLFLPYYLPLIYVRINGLALGSIVFLFLFMLMFLGLPIGYAMILAGYVGLFLLGRSSLAVGGLMGIAPYHATAVHFMAVLPMFMLMGALAFYSGLSEGLFNAANKWLGRLPGGLAIASIAGCAGFSAVCGDSLSTAVTMSKVALPEMRKQNYNASLATGCLAAGGTLGILIPPSVGFIIYALLAEESVGMLFISGAVPGVVLSMLFIVTILMIAMRRPELVPQGESFPLHEKLYSLKGVLPIVVLFILILGGMLSGFFSPNEGGSVGAFGAFIITFFGRKLSFKNLLDSLKDTVGVTGRLFVIIIGVGIFGYFLAATRVPFLLAEFVTGLDVNKFVILALVCVLYIILGSLMNVIPMMMLTLPAILPTIRALGFDTVWFGVIIVILMEMGQITPPIGMIVFAMSSTSEDVPVKVIFRGIIPFVFCMVICIILLVLFPQLALFLTDLLF